MNIQWYPGHMTRTRRMIETDVKLVDVVCEVIDARIPESSRNPDLYAMVGQKPRLVVLNRADQADAAATRLWAERFRAQGLAVLETDCRSGAGIGRFAPAVRALLKDKLDAYAAKGQSGRTLRAMVVGVPNVGKSTFINRVAKKKSAKVSDRPGVTRGKQWVSVDRGLELLDTPGILWPKFDDEETGLHLAFTGAVKDDVLDVETLSIRLMQLLAARYPQSLKERYRLTWDGSPPRGDFLLETAARNRGFLVPGGGADTERMARILLDEFRGGLLGRFTLELPPEGGAS